MMTLLKDIKERQLIKKFKSYIHPAGIVGPGDDAAIIENDVVVTTDIVTFDRHFPSGMTYKQFGWYSAAVNFSDLAAMGARPTGFLAALALPLNLEAQAAYDIISGIDQCTEFCGTGIVGGDTKFGSGIIAGTAIGSMDGRKPMLRSGSLPGDVVAVTGPIGTPAAGFIAIKNGLNIPYAKRRLYVPIPHIAEGIAMASTGAITSCIDLSDGLGTALNIICSASGVGMDIKFDLIPHDSCVEDVSNISGIPIKDIILGWGGEYELLFTVRKNVINCLYDKHIKFYTIGVVNNLSRPYLIEDGKRTIIQYSQY